MDEIAAACFTLGKRCGATAMVFAMHQIQVACIVRHLNGSEWFGQYLRDLVADQRLIASATSEVGTGGEEPRVDRPILVGRVQGQRVLEVAEHAAGGLGQLGGRRRARNGELPGQRGEAPDAVVAVGQGPGHIVGRLLGAQGHEHVFLLSRGTIVPAGSFQALPAAPRRLSRPPWARPRGRAGAPGSGQLVGERPGWVPRPTPGSDDPGRIVGETTDKDGNRAFVLTLQAREQHIRREKASSNICSNQALCAMTASVYAAAMGAEGLTEVARQCHFKAEYLASKLAQIGYPRRHQGAFFHEFVTETPIPAEAALSALAAKGILGGLPAEGGILWCATEMNSKADIDELVDALKEVRA
jgi:hypothetical protein